MLSVLYVDDEQLNLDLMALTFKRDFIVHKAHSGAEALEMLQSLSVTVLISDFKMAEMNGIELIREAKRRHPQLCCMLLSGYNESALEIDEESRRFIAQIVQKPFRKEDLKNLILSYGENCLE